MEPYQSSGSFNRGDQLRHRISMPKSPLSTQEAECRAFAQKAMDKYGTLPPTKSFELYLVQGIAIPFGGSANDARVIFPPEFMFVLDVGLESLIGVDVFWNPVGHGDPRFPDFSNSVLRSITSRDSGHIIYPNITGSIMIGIKEGISDSDVREALHTAGLHNIQGSDWFWTAECRPFIEPSICVGLEMSIPFVKYAEPNSLQRLIDFGPGWSCVRLT